MTYASSTVTPAAGPRLVQVLRSWRLASVSLLSFSSGLPLGLVWYAIPDWMRDIGVDIRLVGLFTLAQAPWTFKVVWSPLVDRFVPPFLGRRRGWMLLMQLALAVLGLLLAGVGRRPEAIWVVGAIALAIALASATQDIAIDAYAVEILHRDEQGLASGARTAVYRAAMLVSGGLAITAAASLGWPAVNLVLAAAYVPMMVITWKAPEPEARVTTPKTLREAVWLPFLGFLSRHRALEILAFVLLYKLADQVAQALTRPFLIDMGYDAYHRGVALGTISLAATIGGAFIGGWITTLAGLGHSLWIFGLLQIFSNLGYLLLAQLGEPHLPSMYAATGFELLTSGLGTGAFSVLLLRLTERRFSATQYALFSSLFALPRVLGGPISGYMVDALAWPIFFASTMVMGLPGLLMLARFVPPGVREPRFTVESPAAEAAAVHRSRREVAARGTAGGLLIATGSLAFVALLGALDVLRNTPGAGFDIGAALVRALNPVDVAGWVQLAGIAAVGLIGGLFVAAASAVRPR